jgi:hypothetical protein
LTRDPSLSSPALLPRAGTGPALFRECPPLAADRRALLLYFAAEGGARRGPAGWRADMHVAGFRGSFRQKYPHISHAVFDINQRLARAWGGNGL